MMGARYKFVLARTWVDDAQSRELDIGEVVHLANNTVALLMTLDQFREAVSDADYQASLGAYEHCGYLPVVRSAKRALVGLERQASAEWRDG